jgi:hypothetical protein
LSKVWIEWLMLLQYLNKDAATVTSDAATWLLIMMLLLGYNEKTAVPSNDRRCNQ